MRRAWGLSHRRYVTVTETFTASGTWVAPANMLGTTAIVECLQAGSSGDGGTALAQGGGGGSEGTYARKTITTARGHSHDYTVGAPGGVGAYNTNAQAPAGGASIFFDTNGTTELCRGSGALGGGQGRNGGVAASTGSVGDSIQIGSNGGTAANTAPSDGAAGAGGTAITGSPSGMARGAGGIGGVSGSPPTAGTGKGAGGGGGRGNSATNGVGQPGSAGLVAITYTVIR